MKKKIYAFLLVLASVIACIVCLAACNKGGEDDLKAEDCVGTYEFVSQTVVTKVPGQEDNVTEYKAGENGVTKELYVLEVKADKTWTMTINMNPSQPQTQQGTWAISGSKLVITADGETQNVSLSGDTLTVKTSVAEQGYSYESVMILKKAAE